MTVESHERSVMRVPSSKLSKVNWDHGSVWAYTKETSPKDLLDKPNQGWVVTSSSGPYKVEDVAMQWQWPPPTYLLRPSVCIKDWQAEFSTLPEASAVDVAYLTAICPSTCLPVQTRTYCSCSNLVLLSCPCSWQDLCPPPGLSCGMMRRAAAGSPWLVRGCYLSRQTLLQSFISLLLEAFTRYHSWSCIHPVNHIYAHLRCAV